MRFLSSSKITTNEFADHLQVTVSRKHGWIELLVEALVLAGITYIAQASENRIAMAVPIVGLVSLIYYWFKPTDTKLFVTQYELTAKGNLGHTFTNGILVPASEVKSLGYFVGNENEPSGLYANRGWRMTCLLPALNKNEANSIAGTIREKFPDLERGDTTPGSILHGDDSGVQTLGLSKSRMD